MGNKQEVFMPESEQLLALLEHHSPNLVSTGVIMSYLDTSINGVWAAVRRAKDAINDESHPLHGQAEIRTAVRGGYSLVKKK